jgi:hypothetical protein
MTVTMKFTRGYPTFVVYLRVAGSGGNSSLRMTPTSLFPSAGFSVPRRTPDHVSNFYPVSIQPKIYDGLGCLHAAISRSTVPVT